MRTNIDLDDTLIREAMRHSRAKTKKAIVEEALRVFIAAKSAAERTDSYRDQLRALDAKLAGLRLRRNPSEILREDRNRV